MPLLSQGGRSSGATISSASTIPSESSRGTVTAGRVGTPASTASRASATETQSARISAGIRRLRIEVQQQVGDGEHVRAGGILRVERDGRAGGDETGVVGDHGEEERGRDGIGFGVDGGGVQG